MRLQSATHQEGSCMVWLTRSGLIRGEQPWWSRNVVETPRVPSVNGCDRPSCKKIRTTEPPHPMWEFNRQKASRFHHVSRWNVGKAVSSRRSSQSTSLRGTSASWREQAAMRPHRPSIPCMPTAMVPLLHAGHGAGFTPHQWKGNVRKMRIRISESR